MAIDRYCSWLRTVTDGTLFVVTAGWADELRRSDNRDPKADHPIWACFFEAHLGRGKRWLYEEAFKAGWAGRVT
jgi:hypothetical protein